MHKPSRKIIALGIVALAVILCSGIFKYKDKILLLKEQVFGSNEEELAVITPEVKIDGIEETTSSVDTDTDGLKDWEEVLWGTDSKNSDTDKDGVKDGEEVTKNRNPLIAGPNDTLSEKEVLSKQELSERQKALTPSDTLARNIFTEVVSLKETNSFTPENKDRVVAKLSNSAKKNFSYNSYTRAGLHVFSSEEKQAIKNYASQFATIQINMFLEMYKNKDVFQHNVSKMSEIYSKAAADLYNIDVPQVVSGSHLTIVNNYELSSASFSYISNYKKDPVTAGIALQYYQSVDESQNVALTNIAEFLRKNDIIFTEGELGNFWNRF